MMKTINKYKVIKKSDRENHAAKKRRANLTLVQLLIEDLSKEDAQKIINLLQKKAALT